MENSCPEQSEFLSHVSGVDPGTWVLDPSRSHMLRWNDAVVAVSRWPFSALDLLGGHAGLRV